MKILSIAIGIIIVVTATGFIRNLSSSNNKAGNGFAVVELFTSEGCSSCPPADAALAKLKTEYGNRVFVMAFHVDYWNRLGWKDEYSNALYSKRQGDYSKLLHLKGVYTPQAVVNGVDQFTGLNVARLHSSINQQLAKTENKNWDLKVKIAGNKVLVNSNAPASKSDVLHITLIENNASSQVTAGENSGRKLQHVNVVRDFITVDETLADKTLQLQIPADVNSNNVSVIAYTQNTSTGAIESVKQVVPTN